MASKNCGAFLASKEANDIRELWLNWMQESYGMSESIGSSTAGSLGVLGAELHGDKEAIPPSVYLDKHGWPMLP
jgi:hypothetical protein